MDKRRITGLYTYAAMRAARLQPHGLICDLMVSPCSRVLMLYLLRLNISDKPSLPAKQW